MRFDFTPAVVTPNERHRDATDRTQGLVGSARVALNTATGGAADRVETGFGQATRLHIRVGRPTVR